MVQFPTGAPIQNEIVEKELLGSMLRWPALLAQAAGKVTVDDFFTQDHRDIASAILALYNQNISVDPSTVQTEIARRKGSNEEATRLWLYMDALTDGKIQRPEGSVDHQVKILREKANLRFLRDACVAVAAGTEDASASAEDLAAGLGAKLLEQAPADERDFADGAQIIQEAYRGFDGFFDRRDTAKRIRTRFRELDHKLKGGFKAGNLIVIAARPSMGKTALGTNIAQTATATSEKVAAFFSLEMGKQELLDRLVAAHARVDSRQIESGNLTRDQRASTERALDSVFASRFLIDDTPGLSVGQLRNKALRLKAKEGRLDLIVVDYLQLLTLGRGQKAENRNQEISVISRTLKWIARELDVPLVALSQLSREVEKRQEKRPQLSDLRESGSIEQDADVCAFLFRPEYYDRGNPELKGLAIVDVAKQRNGPTGEVKLHYIPEYTLFTDPLVSDAY